MRSFPHKSTYESEIESVNFARDSGEIETNVNARVADKTNGMIPEILPEGSLNVDTILVLLNAVYFKCEWNKPIGRSRSSLPARSHVVLEREVS